MKRKVGLLLAAAATVGAGMFATIGAANASSTAWIGPFSTHQDCDQSFAQWVTVDGVSGWDLNGDAVPDASWAGSCDSYSDGYWFPYTPL